MGEVTIELEQAIKTLKLDYDIIHKTEKRFNETLYYALLKKFVQGKDRRWWWEAFCDSFRLVSFEYNPDYIHHIIPDLTKNVWLMIEDDEEPFYPIYDVNPKYIASILNECFGFEYYIIPKDETWLLCENHHHYLIGIGEPLKRHNALIIDYS